MEILISGIQNYPDSVKVQLADMFDEEIEFSADLPKIAGVPVMVRSLNIDFTNAVLISAIETAAAAVAAFRAIYDTASHEEKFNLTQQKMHIQADAQAAIKSAVQEALV